MGEPPGETQGSRAGGPQKPALQAFRDLTGHRVKSRSSGLRRGRPGASSQVRRRNRAGDYRGQERLRSAGRIRHSRRKKTLCFFRETEKDLGNDSNFVLFVI